MKKQAEFILESDDNSLNRCPQCGRRYFKRYIYAETGEEIHPDVGRCKKTSNGQRGCQYHQTPKQYQLRQQSTVSNQLSLEF
jgi:hypothetical protein